MNVKVKLFATLRKNRFDEKKIVVMDSSSILELMNNIGVNPDDVAIIFVNGRHGNNSIILHEGDDVAFFPPIGGG